MTTFDFTGILQRKSFFRSIGWSWLAIAAAVILSSIVPVGAEGLKTSEVSAGSVTLAWTAVGDDAFHGSAKAYDIRYAASVIAPDNFNSANVVLDPPEPLPAGSAESFKVTGLEPSTLYFFAIKVGDDAGNWSGLSNVVARTTATELSAVVGLEARTGSSNGQIDLTWTDPPEIVDTAASRSYLIRYSETVFEASHLASIPTIDTVLPAPATGLPQAITLAGLIPEQRYYLTVQVFDGMTAWSQLSGIVTATAISGITTGVADGGVDDLPASIDVDQNYPNPFNPTTVIEYALPRQMQVCVDIYNSLGRRVARLSEGVQSAGNHRVAWDASDVSGDKVASGVYFYRIEAGGTVVSRKMILLK